MEEFTVHAYVPLSWKTVNMWAWSAPDGTNAFTSWPGEALTEDGDWYVIEVPGWINSVIINANEGTIQTGDLSVDAGMDIWLVITDKDTVSISYKEPTGTVTPPADDKTDDNPSQTEPQPTEPVNNGEKESNNTGLIIGIVAAVIVAAVVVVIVIRKKKH